VRGADAESFEHLLGPWARDRGAVYFEGRKVSGAQRDSFRAIGDAFGADAKRIFYSRQRGDLVNDRYDHKAGFTPRRARAVEVDGRRYLVAHRVFVICDVLHGTDLDPATFQALGHGYARDATHVVWSGPDQAPRTVADTELPTFVVDAAGARDRRGRFVAGARAPATLPVETEGDPARAAGRLTRHLWHESLAALFNDFDRSIVTEDGIVRVGVAGELTTPIPDHRLVVDGPRLMLEAAGYRREGTVSGLELLAGFLYGLARGKVVEGVVCVRVALRTDGEIVSTAGTPPRWQTCLDLAHLLEKLGHRQEAAFLLQRVQRWKPTDARVTTPVESARIRAELLLPELLRDMPAELVPIGGTTQSAAAWVVDHGFHRSPLALVRRDVASYLGQLAMHTRNDRRRLAVIAKPMLVLLDDREPAVRAEAAASIDFLCAQTFDRQAYAEALFYADALVARAINVDMQSARRWECLTALGRASEADAAWATCLRLMATEPTRTPTVPRAYPSIHAWRAAGQGRIARAK
jgi:hypothetical protein